MPITSRRPSRQDTALHRSLHQIGHSATRRGRQSFHLARAAWAPLRRLDELLREIDARGGMGLAAGLLMRARTARDEGWPYLCDETGEVWK
jgi:hypothetical protein